MNEQIKGQFVYFQNWGLICLIRSNSEWCYVLVELDMSSQDYIINYLYGER